VIRTRPRPLLRLVLPALLGVLLLLCPPDAAGAERPTRPGQPHAGYAYPAGGQVGTSFKVNVGGQNLRQVKAVHVSGEGLTTRILFWYPPPRPLDAPQARELRRRLQDLRDRKMPTATGARERRDARRGKEPDEKVELPDHPLLNDLESKSLEELQEVARYFFVRRNPLQRKVSIEETVKVVVTIAPDAEPGTRELRLETPVGMSNPIRFCVGLVPEVREQEPNDSTIPRSGTLQLPVTLNGQILPQDVDRFRLWAKRGEKLVIRAEARALVPYQADSVPGWMQATLTLYDSNGKEVAYADEYRFDPDPVLFYDVPFDGEYELEVQDAIARGREDFVYRVTAGALPFVDRIFPLGGRTGELTRAEVVGWNLDWQRVPLDTRGTSSSLRETAWRQGDGITNDVAYAVDTLPEIQETEPNDDPAVAAPIKLPVIVNGRIGRPDDVDVFPFEARGGDEVVVEVRARSLGSPLDSVVRLVSEKGEVVAWNDDFAYEGLGVRGLGLQTHHADSYLRARIPRSGTYHVRLYDVCQHGGEDYAYRLRVSEPRPDVELFVTPSSINLQAGRQEVISLRAVRKDGYDGDIQIELRGAPEGFYLSGNTIPAGQDEVWMTLTPPRLGQSAPIRPSLVGHLQIGKEEVLRPVQPAEDMMQAFLWRHLVPAQDLYVCVQGNGNRRTPVITVAEDKPVRVPRGGKARIRFRVDGSLPLADLRFELFDPPKGVSVGEAKVTNDGFTLEVKADRNTERTGTADNLLIEVFYERPVPPPEGGKEDAKSKRRRQRQETRRTPAGFLPAVPFMVRRG